MVVSSETGGRLPALPRAAGLKVPAALLMLWLYCVQGLQTLPPFKRHKTRQGGSIGFGKSEQRQRLR